MRNEGKERLFSNGTYYARGGYMQKELMVTLQQMKDALAKQVSSRFPVKISLGTGEVIVRYIRGFADQQANILLISENSRSLAMKILEVKEIATLEFGSENSNAEWSILRAKWSHKGASL